ncbi:hypothetical protein VULLAG_LOCUS651 [Vulpes lagopus]
MADRLPGLTSAPSLPDLPLSTLTSPLTSRFLPRPPARYRPGLRLRIATSPETGTAAAPARMRRRGSAPGPRRARLLLRRSLEAGRAAGGGGGKREAGPSAPGGKWARAGAARGQSGAEGALLPAQRTLSPFAASEQPPPPPRESEPRGPGLRQRLRGRPGRATWAAG